MLSTPNRGWAIMFTLARTKTLVGSHRYKPCALLPVRTTYCPIRNHASPQPCQSDRLECPPRTLETRKLATVHCSPDLVSNVGVTTMRIGSPDWNERRRGEELTARQWIAEVISPQRCAQISNSGALLVEGDEMGEPKCPTRPM